MACHAAHLVRLQAACMHVPVPPDGHTVGECARYAGAVKAAVTACIPISRYASPTTNGTRWLEEVLPGTVPRQASPCTTRRCAAMNANYGIAGLRQLIHMRSTKKCTASALPNDFIVVINTPWHGCLPTSACRRSQQHDHVDAPPSIRKFVISFSGPLTLNR